MFESSLLESGGKLKTKSSRWAIATFFLNTTALLIMVLIPIIYPAALPKTVLSSLIVAPPPPPSAPPAVKQTASAARTASTVPQLIDNQLTLPRTIPTHINMIKDEGPVGANMFVPGGGENTGNSNGNVISSLFDTPKPIAVVRPAVQQKTYAISAGVAKGYLVHQTQPVYPAIARAARTQGTLALTAIISKSGTIENLRVLSGPQLLRQAAIDAVQEWRYRPYLLNGDPVQVETQINVIFSLNY
jgi:protein TonB